MHFWSDFVGRCPKRNFECLKFEIRQCYWELILSFWELKEKKGTSWNLK